MNKRITKYKEYGITLVALVVTIIVLLILAGVTISAILSNNGILNRARDAKELQTVAQIEEELQRAISSLQIDYHVVAREESFREYLFSAEPNKGQSKLKVELGEDNLEFDSINYYI